MAHIMGSSFYYGKPVTEIPMGDLNHFFNQDLGRLRLSGWHDDDIVAVQMEWNRRRALEGKQNV